MNAINVAIIGAGTVGGGTVKILKKQADFFANKLGLPIVLHTVADKRKEAFDALPTEGVAFCDDAFAAVENDEINIVVELVGGTTFAKDLVLKALNNGKHVVTANKALIAKYGPEIFAAAKKNNVTFYFEASVGGGMPTIKTIREALIGNDIESAYAIINGTCNYILTEMTEKGVDFEPTLKEAQELGYAEADPTLDVGGGDTGHKVAIMASLLFGKYVPYDKLTVEGITEITAEDIAAAQELGYAIKLLGVIKKGENGKIDARVNPVMVHKEHMLANVNSVFNAVLVEGDAVGPVLIYGAGAGEMATASAVVGDIVDVARNIKSGENNRIPMDYYAADNEAEMVPAAEIESRYYLNFTVKNSAGVLGVLADSLAKQGISIASVQQKETEGEVVSVVILTFMAKEQSLRTALAEIEGEAVVKAKTKLIRIED